MSWYTSIPTTPDPRSDAKLRAHLVTDHAFPEDVLDGVRADTWKIWHHGDHSTRHPRKDGSMHRGHLQHLHPRYVPD